MSDDKTVSALLGCRIERGLKVLGLAASIIVHEFTHYLQAAKRGFAAYRCEEAIELEREAYGVQNAYIVSYGRYSPVGISMHNAGCGGSASESAVR